MWIVTIYNSNYSGYFWSRYEDFEDHEYEAAVKYAKSY